MLQPAGALAFDDTARPLLSVIVPAYDEAARIGATTARILAFLDSRPYPSELLIVLDGGMPGADAEVRRAAAGRGEVTILDNGSNRGKGFSIRRGVIASRGRFVLFADADLSIPIEGADRFLDALQSGAEVAIASRALRESTSQGERPVRRAMGRLFNWMVRGALLPGLHDTQCGFKAFDGETARRLFAVQRIDRFGFDVEVLAIARRRGLRIVELPVEVHYHASSSVRWLRDGPSMIADLARIGWHTWRGDYEEAGR